MASRVEKRGKLTYYREGERPDDFALMIEPQADGDLAIYFAKLTGGYSARSALGWDKPVSIKLQREIPLVSRGGSGDSEAPASPTRPVEAKVAEKRVFGWQKAPPIWSTRPAARSRNTERHAEPLPGHGLPYQSTMHLVDVLDQVAS